MFVAYGGVQIYSCLTFLTCKMDAELLIYKVLHFIKESLRS